MNDAKKVLSLILILTLVILSGCGEKVISPQNTTQATTPAEKATSAVDVDLTTLSSTMIYGEVYNMVSTPTDYLGKVIKMKGIFNASYYEETQKYYYYVVIADATACCQQGLEFIWQGDHTYPDDYPESGKNVQVQGTFSTYDENGVTYYYIDTDNLVLLEK